MIDVVLAGLPVEVPSDHGVVPAALDHAAGREHPGIRVPEVLADARDRDRRLVVLRRGLGEDRPGDDHRSSAFVAGDEGGVAGAAGLPGQPRAPERLRNRARIDRLDRRLQQVHVLEEERPLLRIEEGEPLVDRDLGRVGLDLREVGIDRRIHDRVGIRQPLRVEADLAQRRRVVVGRAVRPVVLRVRHRAVGREHPVRALREAGDALDRRRVAEKAARAARNAHAVELIVAIARERAVEREGPVLRILLGIAQRRQGDRHLGVPGGGADPSGGLPEVVRPEVLRERPLEEDGVRLDAGRPDPEVDRRVVLVLDVEEDPDVVLIVVDAVAVDVRSPELRDVRVGALERDVEELVVVPDPGHGLDRRRRVVAGIDLVGERHHGGLAPAGIREVAVDLDRGGDPRHLDLRLFVFRRLLGPEPKRRRAHPSQSGERAEPH